MIIKTTPLLFTAMEDKMKRAYILVYIVIIIALLFMIVVAITDKIDNNNITNHYQIENTKLRYAYESAGHETLVRLKNEGYFSDKLHKITNKAGKEIVDFTVNTDKLKNKKARLTYEKNTILLQIEESAKPYQVQIQITPYNELYGEIDNGIGEYKDEWESIFNSKILDQYSSSHVKVNNISIGSQAGKLYYTDNYSTEEELNLKHTNTVLDSLDTVNDNKSTNDTQISNTGSENIEKQVEENFAAELDQKEDFLAAKPQEEESTSEALEAETIEEDFSVDNEILLEDEASTESIDNTENLSLENKSNIEKTTAEKQFIGSDVKSLFLGPKIRYTSGDKISTKGIMHISDDTIIETNIDHYGIILLTGQAKNEGYTINLTGALLLSEDLFNQRDIGATKINLKGNELITISTLSIYEEFYDSKIASFTIK